MLDDDGVLIALILNEQEMPCFVDEFRDSIPTVGGTPDQLDRAPGVKPCRLQSASKQSMISFTSASCEVTTA